MTHTTSLTNLEQRWSPEQFSRPACTTRKSKYSVSLARTSADVEEAQRLRYQVFFEEMGAHADADSSRVERDIDQYDVDCEHLLVRETTHGQIVGCYRLMQPDVAIRRGAFYSDSEFDLSRLQNIRNRTAELGRACIHPAFRSGSVIMLLWSGLAHYMQEHDYEYAIGCASIPLSDGHENATAVCRSLMTENLAPSEYRVFPRNAYPLTSPNGAELVQVPKIPPLLRGYARLGAWIGGAPAWDPVFNTADLFVLLPMARIATSYAKHFGTSAKAA